MWFLRLFFLARLFLQSGTVDSCVVLYIVLSGAGLRAVLIKSIIVLVPLHVPGYFVYPPMMGHQWALIDLEGLACVP